MEVIEFVLREIDQIQNEQSTLSCQVGKETETACGVAEGTLAPRGEGGGARMMIPIARVLVQFNFRPPPLDNFMATLFRSLIRVSLRPSHFRWASTAPRARVIEKSSLIKDEEIPHRTVVLVDPTSNVLQQPKLLNDILASLDRTKFSLLLVDPNHDPPICKLLDKKAEYAKAQAKKAAKKDAPSLAPGTPVKAKAGPPREVQVTWGVTEHDLGHKLAKAKQFLDKGSRVTVVIAVKKGSEAIGAQAKSKVIDHVKTALAEHGTLANSPSNKGALTMLEFKRLEK